MTEIATTQTFQDRMFEKIRDSIGDLMTEEDLKKLVDAALHKAFFEERVTKGQYWNSPEERKPPVLIERFVEFFQPMIDKAVAQYIEDHKDEFKKIIQDNLDKGFAYCVTRSINSLMEQPLSNLAFQFEERLRNMNTR